MGRAPVWKKHLLINPPMLASALINNAVLQNHSQNLAMQDNKIFICKMILWVGNLQRVNLAVLIQDLLHNCGQMSVIVWSSKGSTRLYFLYGSYSGCHLMLLSAGCLIGCVRCGLSSKVTLYMVVVCPQIVSQDKRLGAFYNEVSEATQHHFCHILLTETDTRSIQIWGEETQTPTQGKKYQRT